MTDSICPICQSVNHCMAKMDKSCWCNQLTISQELLDLIVDADKDKSCICRRCIEKFNTTEGH